MTERVAWVPITSSSVTSSKSLPLDTTGVHPVRVLRPALLSPLTSPESIPSPSVFSFIGAHVPGSSTVTLTDGTVVSARHAHLPSLQPLTPTAATDTSTTTNTTITSTTIEQQSLRWISARHGTVPPGAIVAAYDGRTNPVYLARVRVPAHLQHQHNIIASVTQSHNPSTLVSQASVSSNSTNTLAIELANHNHTQVLKRTSPPVSVKFPYVVAQLQPLYKAAISTYPLTLASTQNSRPMQYASHAYDVLCVVRDDVFHSAVVIDIGSISARNQQHQAQCSPCTSASDLASVSSSYLPSSTSSSTSTSASSSSRTIFIPPASSLQSNTSETHTTAMAEMPAGTAQRLYSVTGVVSSTVVNDTSTANTSQAAGRAPTNGQLATVTAVATRLRALCLARREQQRQEQLQEQQQQRRRRMSHDGMQPLSSGRNQDSSTGVIGWLDAESGCSVAGAIKTGASRCLSHRHRQPYGRHRKISYQIARRRPRPYVNTIGYTGDRHHESRDEDTGDYGLVVGNLPFGACGFAWVPDDSGNVMRNAVACCEYQLLAIVSDDNGEDDDNMHAQQHQHQHQHQQEDLDNHSRISWKPIDLDLLSRFPLSPASSSYTTSLNNRPPGNTTQTTRGSRRRRREQERLCADELVVAGKTMCDQGVEETYIARVRIGDVDMPATYVPSLCAALCVTADDHGRIVARRKFELLCVRGHTSAATGPAEAVMGYWAEKQRCRVGAMMVTMAMILGGTAVSSRGIRGVERIYIGGQKGRLNWTGVRRRNWSDDDDYDDGYGDDDDNDDDDDESDCSGQNGDVIKQSFYVPHSRQTRGTELESGLSRSTSINFNSTYNNATNSSISNSISSSTSIRRYSKNQTMNYQTFDQSSSQPHIEHQDDDQDSYNMAQYGLHWVHCTDGDIPRNAVVAFEDDASLATVSSHTNAGCTYVARLCVSGHHQDRNGLGDSVEEDSAHGVDIDFDREIPRCYVAAGVRHKEIAVATTVKTRRSRRRCFGGHRNGSGNDNNGNKRRGARLQLSTRVSSEYDVLTMETMSSRNNQERKTIDTMLRWVSVHPQESESHDAYHSIHRSPLVPQSVSSWSQSSHRPQTRWRIPGNAVAVPVNDGRTMEVGRVTRGASSSYADTGSVTVAEPGYILRGRRVSPGQRYDDGTLRDRRRGRWRLGTFEAQARTGYGNREICEGRTVTRSQADYDGDWNYWDWDWDWECEVLCIFPSNTNTITNTVGQQASVTTTIMSARPTASPMCLRIDVDAGRCRREGEEEEGEWWTQTMLLAARGETSGMIVRGDDGLTEIERDEARWQWRRMGGDGGSEWEWERAERKRTRAKMIVIAAEIGMCAVVGMYLVWIFGLWPSSA